jgi:hypothetical protein
MDSTICKRDSNQIPKVRKLVNDYENMIERINRCAERPHPRSVKMTLIKEVAENQEFGGKEPEIVIEESP